MQVWFPRAVEAVKENIGSWFAQKNLPQDEEYKGWLFYPRHTNAIEDIFRQFSEGRTANKFAANIRNKLGDDVRQVLNL